MPLPYSLLSLESAVVYLLRYSIGRISCFQDHETEGFLYTCRYRLLWQSGENFTSQVTSDDFPAFNGSSSTPHNVGSILPGMCQTRGKLAWKCRKFDFALEQALYLFGSIRKWFLDQGERHRCSAGYRSDQNICLYTFIKLWIR